MSRHFDFMALIGYCGFIFWLSDQERLPAPHLFDNEDKLHHFTAYAVMAVLAWRTFRHRLRSRTALFLASAVFCSLYGISDEWHQSFIVGRESSALDWLADTAGGAAASFMLYWQSRKTPAVLASRHGGRIG